MTYASARKGTLSRSALLDLIGTLPRVPLAYLPTPLDDAPRLRAALGPDAPQILIKREDQTGLALGGNKVRHLEYRLGDMKKKGADSLVVTNVAQSNHARLHTALAAKHGLTSYIIKIPSEKDDPVNGNLLLDHIMGAHIVEAPSADSRTVDGLLDTLIADLEAQGHVVYNVPHDPFSTIAGAIAYLGATVELLDQLDALNMSATHIFLAAGNSAAGLALGGKLLGSSYVVHPVSVSHDRASIEASVCQAANHAAELLGLETRLDTSDIVVHDEYVGERYGVPTQAGIDAIRLLGRTEGLILDPVYTAKACSALIDQVRTGAIGSSHTVVFVHTGGLPITFAYAQEILGGLRQEENT
jgi:1-aminocyclopropane-1-carboxylate deaminase/D-cysteine desulfhydrase-like pyridoxal-dependent ACC family enzyme